MATLVRIGAIGALAIAAAHVQATESVTTPDPVAFDELLAKVDHDDFSTLDNEQQQRTFEKLRTLLPPGDAHRQRLFDSLRCLGFGNDWEKGYKFGDAGLTDALKAGDGAAAVRFYLCRAAFQVGVHGERDAISDYDRAIELARSLGDEYSLIYGLYQRGMIYGYQGQQGKAIADLLEAHRLAEQKGMQEVTNASVLAIGVAYRSLGDYDRAEPYMRQSLEHARNVGNQQAVLTATTYLGLLEQARGHTVEATKLVKEALSGVGADTDATYVASTTLTLATIYNDAHDATHAEEALRDAESLFAAIGDKGYVGSIAYEHGRILAAKGKWREALAQFDIAQADFEKSDQLRYQEWVHKAKADALGALGEHAPAMAEYERFLTVHDARMRQNDDQRAQLLESQFELERSKQETAKLKAEAEAKDREIALLAKSHKWQTRANIAVGAFALLALLITARRFLRRAGARRAPAGSTEPTLRIDLR